MRVIESSARADDKLSAHFVRGLQEIRHLLQTACGVRIYLSGVDVLRMHHALIERGGGLHGISNSAEIDAVLERVSVGQLGDTISEAAALIDGFLTKRPFIDGNRRVAFVAANAFLGLNGCTITATPAEALAYISRFDARESPDLEEIRRWLADNTAPA